MGGESFKQLGELEDEHDGDDGAFAELGKINKATVTARLRGLRFENEELIIENRNVLGKYLSFSNQQADLKRAVKEAEEKLDALAYAKYPTLTEAELKTLVVRDKWLAALDTAIHGEMDGISQALTQRVKELTERYETPLPQMTSRVAELEQKVNRHLERMGFQL